MKVADRLHMGINRCMEEHSSTDLIDWLYFFEEQEKAESDVHSKQDYYLAQIALLVRQVIEVLCDVKLSTRKTLEDMLLKFVLNESEADEYEVVRRKKKGLPTSDPYKPLPRDSDGKLIGGIDTDDPGPLPEHWQEVNARAQLSIGAMLGVNLTGEGVKFNGSSPGT